MWDALIDANCEHISKGTSFYITDSVMKDPTTLYQLFASLSPFERRIMANAFYGIMEKRELGSIRTRALPNLRIGYPFFFFLVVDYGEFKFKIEEDINTYKRRLLKEYLYIQKHLYPTNLDFVGIVVSSIPFDTNLEISYIDTRNWSESDFSFAAQLASQYRSEGYLPDPVIRTQQSNEYTVSKYYPIGKGNVRNIKCPCGSGRKYKNCCGKNKCK